MPDVTEVLEEEIEAAEKQFSGVVLLDLADAIEVQQVITGLRAQVLDAEIRSGNFKEDLRHLVRKLREAIEAEREETGAEIERLNALLDSAGEKRT